jgi:RpiR family transcriptional regulator, carbohydrate utilization regulator
MPAAGQLLVQLRLRRDGLSRSERKVADVVADDAERILGATLAEVARAAGVSEPTVVRFCRSLGLKGYGEFKVRLAQSLVHRGAYADLEVRPGDPASVYAPKIFDATIDMLARVRHALDPAALEAATDLLARAHKIEFYGVGASGAVAIDAQHKFFRLMAPCVAYTDTHMQYMSAATLGPQDVVVAISHTGRTLELIESAALARRSGASVIALTAPGTPLATASTVTLAIAVPEDTDVYTPMQSRMAHLVVIDVLAVGLALRGGEATRARLEHMKAMLRAKRHPRGGED